ncbi:MAG TPA: FAD-dependent oxidoreductase [Solirubrobacteraceae bacterium]|nr:FAD-dependent oxidoreductase [Solirubrobacteraceae bacterium]
MRFAVAGGGVAGLAAALAVARAGHEAVVVERDAVGPQPDPGGAFDVARHGIPHFLQPHAFLPRGRRVLRELAPDVLQALRDVGAEEQDVAQRLRGPREPGDEDLVYLWVRRPLIEWALRRAAAAEPGVELRAASTVTGLVTDGEARATGLRTDDGDDIRADVVVDALGRYRTPAGWPRAEAQPVECGAIYYCRYFALEDGARRPDGGGVPNPRGDLGYMGFNTFRGDNRTFAIILLVPAHDRELRVLRDDDAWMAACGAIRPLDAMTSPGVAHPLTDVLPMGGLSNVLRTGDPGVRGLAPVGDALCHTNPSYAFGMAFALVHAQSLARAASAHADADAIVDAFLDDVRPEARERYAFACETDAARVRAWRGERLEVGRRDGCYPLFAFAAALAAAPYDDLVLRRAIGRIGLLDRLSSFDDDPELHDRIERIFAELMADPPAPPGPPREELLALASAHRTS